MLSFVLGLWDSAVHILCQAANAMWRHYLSADLLITNAGV